MSVRLMALSAPPGSSPTHSRPVGIPLPPPPSPPGLAAAACSAEGWCGRRRWLLGDLSFPQVAMRARRPPAPLVRAGQWGEAGKDGRRQAAGWRGDEAAAGRAQAGKKGKESRC